MLKYKELQIRKEKNNMNRSDSSSSKLIFKFKDGEWRFPGPTRVMGILNATPDSFSDGGHFTTIESAMKQAEKMITEGADAIDIGGESTRPGAEYVSIEEEKRRIIPIIRELRRNTTIPIIVDTRKSEVAKAALEAGANIINDVSGLSHDPAMLELLKSSAAGAILMHMRGTPQTMQQLTEYDDLTAEINRYFESLLEKTKAAGIDSERLVFDPGIGFSKTVSQNLELLAKLSTFHNLGRPLLTGVSRKSFIGKLLDLPKAQDRTAGTAGAVAVAVFQGTEIIRVHDVKIMREAAMTATAIRNYQDLS